MTLSDSACPVCSDPVRFTTIPPDDALVPCPRCGKFAISRPDAIKLVYTRSKGQFNRFQISALLRERSIKGSTTWLQDGSEACERPGYTAIDVKELIRQWPQSVPERLDRTLCNLARLSHRAGDGVLVKLEEGSLNFAEHEASLAFAETVEEARYNLDALVEYGFLKPAMVPNQGTDFILTPKGWGQFEKLTRGASAPDNPVFVAMWIGDAEEKKNMDEAFEQAIDPAIKKAGYRVTRVDLEEHNDWIMDQVLGDIRLAPFVVADFTGHRNGVYFEAGFARGLGIPVISACREDCFDKAHFDTKQLNHVLWTTPQELERGLYNRIVGTIGPGPHSPR